jgi:hypothetical protein
VSLGGGVGAGLAAAAGALALVLFNLLVAGGGGGWFSAVGPGSSALSGGVVSEPVLFLVGGFVWDFIAWLLL